MSDAFDSFPWHDAEIQSIEIPRDHPGAADRVVMFVQPLGGPPIRFVFQRCLGLHLDMRFGIVAEESVRSARRVTESDELRALRQKWASLGVDVTAVQEFSINTNSTNSTIRIMAVDCLAQLMD